MLFEITEKHQNRPTHNERQQQADHRGKEGHTEKSGFASEILARRIVHRFKPVLGRRASEKLLVVLKSRVTQVIEMHPHTFASNSGGGGDTISHRVVPVPVSEPFRVARRS